MTDQPTRFNRTRTARVTAAAEFGERGMRGGEFADDRRHSDDEHMKAASEEDKLPNSRIKSICRGCQANRSVSAHQVANPKRGC